MSVEAKRAYRSWADQRHRCSNKNLDCYKYYGAKGIQVKYCAREFVGWWLEKIKSFKGKRPTISRIDHDGHYEFGNIKLEDHKSNCVTDVLRRHGAPGLKCGKKIICFNAKNGKAIEIFNSGVEASKKTGVNRSNIYSLCKGFAPNGRRYFQTKSGLTFRFFENQARQLTTGVGNGKSDQDDSIGASAS